MRSLALAALITLGAAPVHADGEPPPAAPRTPFDRGRVGLSLGGGSQRGPYGQYFVIGAGVGYFLLDGVEVGLSALHEFGDGPSISKVAPSLRYIAQPLVGKWPLIPYVGVFYNHWFIGGVSDLDTVGARGGGLYVSGQLVLGIGLVVENVVSKCTSDCSSVYPDFTISLAL